MPESEQKDVYVLDATDAENTWRQLAIAALQYNDASERTAAASEQAAEYLGKLADKSGDVEDQQQKMTKAVFSAGAALEVLKKGAQLAFEFLKQGLEGVIADSEGMTKLAAATRNMGYDAEKLVPILEEQSDELEKLWLVDANVTRGMQQLMLQFGIAPGAIDTVTRAVLNYSAATGTDARNSMTGLLRAVENGKEELAKFGVQIETTGDATKDLELVAAELEKRFGGSAAAAAEGLAGTMGQLQRATEDLAKALASFVLSSGVGEKVVKALTEGLDGLTYALSQEAKQESEKLQRQNQLNSAMETRIRMVDRARALEASLATASREGVGIVRAHLDEERARIRVQDERIAKMREEIRLASEATVKEAEQARAVTLSRSSQAEAMERERQLNNQREERERAAAERQKELNRERVAEAERMARAVESIRNKELERTIQADSREFAELNRSERLKRTIRETFDKIEEKRAKDMLEVAKKAAEERKEIEESQLRDVARIQSQIISDMKSAGEQLLSLATTALRDYLVTNQEFTAQYQELSIQRRVADLEEQGVTKTRAEVAQELAEEEANAGKKRLAEALASIAQQAAIKAVFMGAEALAMLAVFNYPGAAAAGAAAAAYAAVAGLAGGAAYAITQSRGFTSEERSTIEGMRRRDEKEKNQVKSGTSKSPTSPTTPGGTSQGEGTVVVYNVFGVAGWTDAQQANALRELMKRHQPSSIGSGR